MSARGDLKNYNSLAMQTWQELKIMIFSHTLTHVQDLCDIQILVKATYI